MNHCFNLEEGLHELKWTYSKDGGGGSTDCNNTNCDDAAFIDDFKILGYLDTQFELGDVNLDNEIISTTQFNQEFSNEKQKNLEKIEDMNKNQQLNSFEANDIPATRKTKCFRNSDCYQIKLIHKTIQSLVDY